MRDAYGAHGSGARFPCWLIALTFTVVRATACLGRQRQLRSGTAGPACGVALMVGARWELAVRVASPRDALVSNLEECGDAGQVRISAKPASGTGSAGNGRGTERADGSKRYRYAQLIMNSTIGWCRTIRQSLLNQLRRLTIGLRGPVAVVLHLGPAQRSRIVDHAEPALIERFGRGTAD